MNNWYRSSSTFGEVTLISFLTTAGVFAVAAVFILIFAWPVQLLWNWLVPAIFNGPAITFWQAVGLETLSCLLLKSGVSTGSK